MAPCLSPLTVFSQAKGHCQRRTAKPIRPSATRHEGDGDQLELVTLALSLSLEWPCCRKRREAQLPVQVPVPVPVPVPVRVPVRTPSGSTCANALPQTVCQRCREVEVYITERGKGHSLSLHKRLLSRKGGDHAKRGARERLLEMQAMFRSE